MTKRLTAQYKLGRTLTQFVLAAIVGVLGGITVTSFADSESAPPPKTREESPAAGRAYALENCAQCHNIGERPSKRRVNAGAPDFVAVANEKTTSIIGLNAFLMTPHPTMPNLIIAAEDRRNVIAYILSLRHPRKSSPTGT